MKKLLSLLLVIALIFSLGVNASAKSGTITDTVNYRGITVTLNNTPITLVGAGGVAVEPFLYQDTTYLPLRAVGYALGLKVGWDNVTGVVTLDDGGTVKTGTGAAPRTYGSESKTVVYRDISLKINGKSVTPMGAGNVAVEPFMITDEKGDGTVYLPLRAVANLLGLDVGWDNATSVVTLKPTTEGSAVGGKPAAAAGSDTEKKVLTSEEIYSKCAPAVFYIETYDADGYCIGTGSGFFLDANGTAATNYHVIYGAASAKITVSDTGMVYDVAGVYDYNSSEDWAVLKISGSGFSYLTVGGSGSVVGGAAAYAIGSPLGLQNTISQGIISNPARTDGAMTYIQTSAAISPGSSGGALINKYGEVIGITAASYVDGQNLNLAVPVTYLNGYANGSVVPISSAYVLPTGTLTLSTSAVSLKVGGYFDVKITAKEFDCDEDTWLYWDTDDYGTVSCDWGGWDSDDVTTLRIYAESVGTTNVYVSFYTDSDILLDEKCITVSVGGATLSADSSYVTVDTGRTATLWFTVDETGYQGSYYVQYDRNNACSTAEWGDWDGCRIPLIVTGMSGGLTRYTVNLCDSDTDAVMDTCTVYISTAA